MNSALFLCSGFPKLLFVITVCTDDPIRALSVKRLFSSTVMVWVCHLGGGRCVHVVWLTKICCAQKLPSSQVKKATHVKMTAPPVKKTIAKANTPVKKAAPSVKKSTRKMPVKSPRESPQNSPAEKPANKSLLKKKSPAKKKK